MPTQPIDVAHRKQIELLHDRISDLLLERHELIVDFDALEKDYNELQAENFQLDQKNKKLAKKLANK